MRTSRILICLSMLIAAGVADAAAQDELAGYLKVDHTIYDKPHGEVVQKLSRGQRVQARPVEGQPSWVLIFRVDDGGVAREVGYTLNPWLDDAPPLAVKPRPVSADETNGVEKQDAADEVVPRGAAPHQTAGSTETRYVHLFSNVRVEPTGRSEAVAQLPPGTQVELLQMDGNWALVRLPGAASEGPLGYVSAALLMEAPPTTQQTTLVYITRTGTKYHSDGCRHLQHSKYSMTLGEALEEGFEPCKVCDPPTVEEP